MQWRCLHGEVKIEKAAAAGKKSTTSLSFVMETYGLEVEEELPTMATQYWAEESMDNKNGVMSKKKLG